MRRGGAKVAEQAARWIRAGHPWVFRDALLRPLEGVATGAAVAVADGEGNHLGYALYEPEGAVALRMVAREREFDWTSEVMLARLRAAKAHRARYVEAGFRGAARLIHSDADGFPGVAVDRYGEFLLIYKYAPAADSYLDQLVPLLEQEHEPAGIYLQDRTRAVAAEDSHKRPPASHLAGKTAPPEFEVEEDGLKFIVDVTAPVSPGLFLDLREGRRLVERIASGRRVLNLFSFTGALALRAVRGGAADVTNVDAAARSHARCRQNLAASGLDPEACEALSGDVFKHLERFRQRDRVFDLVVVDPPPFSTVKGSTFSALDDWDQLATAIAHVVAPAGEVLAVANAASLTEEEFLGAVGEGTLKAGRNARVIAECGLPPDFPVLAAFPEGKYLKVKLLSLA
ncbi:class I SAM-dependent rRNA methyltransferase [Enhygromyxa salina]|uniref:class I SAM-dependent rRNA methyltransferase n=1 Tax=Enhygromyxa salina TaxID=215803 RepID=UPI0015E5D798|nr:class I SAM-dependent rRNA methyltransferase [Enhygromyxa salina]